MRLFVAALAAIVALPASAQEPIPRTPDGKPDMQGFWSAEFLTPLERPDKFPDLVIPPEREAEAIKEMTPDFGEVYDPELDYFFPTQLLVMNGEFRSSTLISPEDGKLPLTALGRAAADHYEHDFDDPENRPGSERCVDGVIFAPLRVFGYLAPHQIVQTPGAVVFVAEDIDPVRIVSIGGGAASDVIRTRSGASRGQWEGDTLVVETNNLRVYHPSGIDWRGEAVVTEDSRIIERFTMISADEILFRFTIEDPSLYSRPWLAEFSLHRTDLATKEYACHEGNHSLVNILTAARMGLQEEDDD
jgi:hypothetical protein